MDESEALFALLDGRSDAELAQRTQFDSWTVSHVIGHLHMWNWAADLSLQGGAEFTAFIDSVLAGMHRTSLRTFEDRWLDGLSGRELLETWHGFPPEMTDRFAGPARDPPAPGTRHRVR
jgi:hypothetical protein